jgi:predicted DNA-binding protein YlxM (UPF0122 family)
LAELRDQFALWMKKIQDQVNMKADRSALLELEKLTMIRLNDLKNEMYDKFADKIETKKALKTLERQLKNLYDLYMSITGTENKEDAMFSTKGFSCASCAKNLTNLYGKKAEFYTWSKMPYRDPAERIHRVGQGFSKMLSTINPEQVSRYEQASRLQDGEYRQ